MNDRSDKLTRGDFVGKAFVLPALAATFALAANAPASAQAGKGAPAQFKYQTTPKNGQQCSGCTFFIPGKSATADGTCKVVAGPIAPKGWCIAYSAKK